MNTKKKSFIGRIKILKPATKAMLPVCEECGRSAPVNFRTGLCIKCDIPKDKKP